MATLRDYSSAQVAMSWGGINFVGFAPDTFVTLSRNSPNTNNNVGADGSVGITLNADKSGTVEITLMQTSTTHRYLSAAQAQQDLSGKLFRSNMTITDPSGGFIAKAQRVHIMEPPEVTLGSDQNEKTWTFYAERIDYADTPAGFAQNTGEASRIDDALSGLEEVTDSISEFI